MYEVKYLRTTSRYLLQDRMEMVERWQDQGLPDGDRDRDDHRKRSTSNQDRNESLLSTLVSLSMRTGLIWIAKQTVYVPTVWQKAGK